MTESQILRAVVGLTVLCLVASIGFILVRIFVGADDFVRHQMKILMGVLAVTISLSVAKILGLVNGR